jgi:hypothetical protein
MLLRRVKASHAKEEAPARAGTQARNITSFHPHIFNSRTASEVWQPVSASRIESSSRAPSIPPASTSSAHSPRCHVIRGSPVASAAQVPPIARFGGCPPVGAVITKDYCTYTIIILRQEKILRDHGRAAVCQRYRGEFRLGMCASWHDVAAQSRQGWNRRVARHGGTTTRAATQAGATGGGDGTWTPPRRAMMTSCSPSLASSLAAGGPIKLSELNKNQMK